MAWVAIAGWVLLVTLALVLPLLGRTTPTLLLTTPTRLPLLVGSGAATLLFAAQAGVIDTVADLAGAGLLDQRVWSWFVNHRDPAVTGVMTSVSSIGGTVGMALLALLAALVLWRSRRRAEAAVVVVAAIGASLLVTGFKNLYARARPPVAEQLTVQSNAALPSGHALGSMVVLGVLAAVVVILVRRPALQVLAVLAAVVGVVSIGVSRLYLGVHWLTDVLTGWLLGGAWLATCVTALVLLHLRRSRSSDPVPPEALIDVPPGDGAGR